jgi:histidine ammonia-lyase
MPTTPAPASDAPTIRLTYRPEVGLADAARVMAGTARVEVEADALSRLDAGRDRLAALAREKTVYGVNTGFGPMVTERIEPGRWGELQVNLIRSHAAGLGAPLPDELVRGVLFARLMTLLRGGSAVGREPVLLLAGMLNGGACPIIPEHGSVGASGDLVQLAHVALALLGEGEVSFQGRVVPAADALRSLDLTPLRPTLREGLALINGTAAMTGVALRVVLDARRLFDWSLALSALLQEVVASPPDPFSAELNAAKRHPGQSAVAARMRALLAGSRRLRAGHEPDNARPLQEHYSLRCVPQIAGPILETLEHAERVVLDELHSASDNPLFDPETGELFHGGNFHGDYVSLAADTLKIATVKLTLLAERQLNFLLNDSVNRILPPFLNLGRPGLQLGLQGAQFTATSTAAESQTLAYPMSLHTIPCNRDNQDVVSMGTNAALLARRVVGNGFDVLSVLALAALQAVDALGIADDLAPATAALYRAGRTVAPPHGRRRRPPRARPARRPRMARLG